MTFLPKRDLLTLEELDRLCSAFITLGIRKLRITGGEPLVRRNILEFLRSISRHIGNGLDELTVTTNGSQLSRFAEELFAIGIRRINVSLDTLDAEKFASITRWGRLEQVLQGIHSAQQAGLKVKINTVALKGFNDNEFLALTEWCARHDMDITFIEVMPMGDISSQDRLARYLSVDDVQNILDQKLTQKNLPVTTGGPARYVVAEETGQRIGFISPLSHNFCESCNRVRLTCTGELFMCLGQEDRADLRHVLREHPDNDWPLFKAIRSAISRKPKGHDFDYSRQNVLGRMARHMSHTGG